MISESHIWRYRDSFYEFVLAPENHVPGFILGVLYAAFAIFFWGLADNPLLVFIVQVLSVMALYLVLAALWEGYKFRKMTEAQKTQRWDITADAVSCTDGTGHKSTYRWNRIDRVKSNMSGYMLHRTNGAPKWVPLSLFSPEQAEKFERLFPGAEPDPDAKA